jgi:hypothetical protein
MTISSRRIEDWPTGLKVSLLFVAFLLLAAIGCTSKETHALLQPAEALGTVVAEETMLLAGPNKRIVIISPDANWGPLSTAEQTFRAALKKQGYAILAEKSANVGDPMRSGEVGLKPADFVEILEKSRGAGAIVSFAGAPLVKAAAAELAAEHPPVLVVATGSLGNLPGLPGDQSQLGRLLDAKIVQEAVIDRGLDGSAPRANSEAKSGSVHGIFSEKFQMLKAP